MKKLLCFVLSILLLAGCAAPAVQTAPPPASVSLDEFDSKWADSGFVRIWLDDSLPAVTLPEGAPEDAVTFAKDIIYYEEGHDENYGEGGEGEAHSAEEAAKHTVIHINAPGTYVLRGKLSLGQIAVDLGEEAKNDPAAVVTLILDGVDITCSVAPAVIFYNVYECGDAENPTAVVDTSAAGANVILAERTPNYVNGSHVAKIYWPGTEKKLHKYDGAFYSRMSMNVGGGGFLMITADNEGLCSERHLTINSGEIYIRSGNDGINTNEDGVSVTTINGGILRIDVTGETGEGDGIDSNGWLVINGGNVSAYACATSGDAGIDSDMGICINGGTVVATGNMLDRIEGNSQTHAVFSFAQPQTGGTYTLKNEKGTAVIECEAPNAFTHLLLSSPELTEGTYTLWSGDTQFEGIAGMGGGFFGDLGPIERPDWPDRPGKGEGGDVEIPPQPTMPIVTHGTAQPPQGEQPENMPMPNMPQGVEPPQGGGQNYIMIPATGILSTNFPITQGANYFSGLRPAE